MRQHALILTSLALAATGFGATSAAAQEEYRHGHIRNVEPGVTVQRATEVTAEEAVPNLPFLPGDRVWTDAAGRAEFQFPEGTVIRLDRGSKLDYSDHDESRDERVVLRLWSGSLILRARAPESAVFEIETPGGLVQAAGPGIVRIDVEGGETQLSVYEGEASLDTGRDSVRLTAGERTFARWGDGPAAPAPFDRYAQDDFGQWDGDLESRTAWAANSSRYLPQELEPYAPEFDTHGTWAYEEPVGYVWQPRVTTGWAPYTNGRWTWTSYGWTWVPYESWGWAPHHYGRWGFSGSLGWYWAPGTVWGGGWVNWGVGGGYVGWCALGWNNRPVVPWRHHRGGRGRGPHDRPRGHAVPRGSVGHDRAWSVVKREHFGRGNGARGRVDARAAGALQVADSIHARPDRGARALTRAAAVPRAASARPRAGASSRALRGASPVPMGSAALGQSSARSRGGVSTGAPRSGSAGGASERAASARARSRSGSIAERGTPSSAQRSGSPSWIGSSRANRSRPAARPSPSRSGDRGALGSGFRSRDRSSGSSRPPRPGAPGASTRSPDRGSSGGVTSRPRSRSGSVTSSPRSNPSGGVSSRPRSSGSLGAGTSSRPRSGGVSSSPRSSGSRSSGVSSRSRSGASRSSGVSSRPRSGASRSSAPRSSGVSSRSRSSAPRSSGASRSGSRSSGAASRSRGGASRSSGGSRSSTSRSGSSPRSGSGSAARSRGGSRKP